MFSMRRDRQSPTEKEECCLHRVAIILAEPVSETGFLQTLPHHEVARVSRELSEQLCENQKEAQCWMSGTRNRNWGRDETREASKIIIYRKWEFLSQDQSLLA